MRVVSLLFSVLFIAFSINSCVSQKNKETSINLSYVDPFIGSDAHGHVFVGANVPFGAVQAGPNNYVQGWDWCSGYHYSDSIVTGFSQLHLSGTGIGDLGDVLITPYTGTIKVSPGTIEKPLDGYASTYSHDKEVAEVGYYALTMDRYNIKVELSATERVAFHNYTFPAHQQSHIAVNLESGIGWDTPVETYLKQINDSTLIGYRFSNGWAKDQRLYFAIRLAFPIDEIELFNKGNLVQGTEAKGNKITGIINFSTQDNENIMLKVGISPVSEQNALDNIETEIPDWDFQSVVKNAQGAWNKELGRIQIKTNDEHILQTFYTALYHSFIHPVLFNDCNGDYRGADKEVYSASGTNNYSIFSLWDTYRAAHPLYTLIQPEKVPDFINSMLNIYKQQGKLPIWHLMGNETDCMVGYSAVPVIADAYFKGFEGFDVELAYEAMKASSTRDDYGVNLLKKKGYIPADKEKESVSKALEYAISDWCIAQMAKKLERNEDYVYYSKRAQAYSEYFDPKTKFMRAKLNNGEFREPFSPFKSMYEIGDYTEGNAWQYTWLVPHDVEGLINLFNGDKNFTAKLDSLFLLQGDLGEDAPPDISGLIGQYAHGNEPGHHITYLYAYAGKQWKTAEKVRQVMNEMYTNKPDGLCGNEDCGQMSAWYIWSALGFYPVNPSNGAYVFGSPLVDEAMIKLANEKSFRVVAHNNNSENIYIQSVKLNGTEYSKSYITHKDILLGGKLEFFMGNKPNKEFGSGYENLPKSIMY